MLGFGFGGFNRKPRQFTYTPRSYDPEKEAREQRRRELLGEEAADTNNEKYIPGTYIRNQRLGRTTSVRGKRDERRKTSTMRVVIALILMAIVAYFLIRF